MPKTSLENLQEKLVEEMQVMTIEANWLGDEKIETIECSQALTYIGCEENRLVPVEKPKKVFALSDLDSKTNGYFKDKLLPYYIDQLDCMVN